MDPDFSDLSLSDSLPSDIGVDGSLSVDNGVNLSADQVPDYSPLSSSDIAPVDNINGTSGSNGDPTPALYNMFTSTGLLQTVNGLTGGANYLANELPGIITPTPANQTESTGGISTTGLLLIGGAALLLILVLK